MPSEEIRNICLTLRALAGEFGLANVRVSYGTNNFTVTAFQGGIEALAMNRQIGASLEPREPLSPTA